MSASPSIAPDQGGPIYFVLCDYGPDIGRAYRETDPDEARHSTRQLTQSHGLTRNRHFIDGIGQPDACEIVTGDPA